MSGLEYAITPHTHTPHPLTHTPHQYDTRITQVIRLQDNWLTTFVELVDLSRAVG